MGKIKQNPKKILGVVAGVFFLLALILMVLPGVNVGIDMSKIYPQGLDVTYTGSLFALAFGGTLVCKSGDQSVTGKFEVNANALVAFIMLILVIVCIILILVGLFTDKINKKGIIIISVLAIIMVLVAAILLLAAKESFLRSVIVGSSSGQDKKPTADEIDTAIKGFKAMVDLGYGSYGLGAGAIVTPIMAFLGLASLTGAVIFTAKE